MTASRRCAVRGADALETTTSLCRRIRLAHPTAGLFQAPELQWWWAMPRSTGEADSAESITFCPLVPPDASGELLEEVVADGSGPLYRSLGFEPVVVTDLHERRFGA